MCSYDSFNKCPTVNTSDESVVLMDNIHTCTMEIICCSGFNLFFRQYRRNPNKDTATRSRVSFFMVAHFFYFTIYSQSIYKNSVCLAT